MIAKIEGREIIIETGQDLRASNLKEAAEQAAEERGNVRKDRLKFYEEAANQDKEFQSAFLLSNFNNRIETALRSLQDVNVILQARQEERRRLEAQMEEFLDIHRSMAQHQGIILPPKTQQKRTGIYKTNANQLI